MADNIFPHFCLGDLNALRTILLYHFSNGIFINGGLEGGVTNLLKTIQGNNLQVLSVCGFIFGFASQTYPHFMLNSLIYLVQTTDWLAGYFLGTAILFYIGLVE